MRVHVPEIVLGDCSCQLRCDVLETGAMHPALEEKTPATDEKKTLEIKALESSATSSGASACYLPFHSAPALGNWATI